MKHSIAVLAMAALVVACGGGDDGGGGADLGPASAGVAYTVTGIGTTRASLTHTNSSGGTEQRTVTLPWTNFYSMKRGDHLYLSAQNESQSGSVTVKISGGGPDRIATSSGAYGIATASGLCCK